MESIYERGPDLNSLSWPFNKVCHSRFYVSPLYDLVFLIGAPLIALFLSFLFFRASSPLLATKPFGLDPSLTALLIVKVFTQSHIFLVFGRSHLNARIFKEFPIRFTLVPLFLILLSFLSDSMLILGVVVGGLWDIYHSSLQTFGLSRIYDHQVGNNPKSGRTLDIYLSHFLYMGAIICGVNLIPLLRNIFSYRNHPTYLNDAFFLSLEKYGTQIQTAFWMFSIGFLAFYFWSYKNLITSGYKLSIQKLLNFGLTGCVCFYAWGTFPLPIALFVVNFFHAWQYFAILWHTDNANMKSLATRKNSPYVNALILFLFLAIPFSYGSAVIFNKGLRFLFCISTVFSLMHYWYDGFIWSVRKNYV